MVKGAFNGWIKPSNYGITRDPDTGVECVALYPWWGRMLMRGVKPVQKFLWLCGIAVYDPIFGECTPDFNCCAGGRGGKRTPRPER